jgi:hypothetical protein
VGRDQLNPRRSDDDGDGARPYAGDRLIDEAIRLVEQFADNARSEGVGEQLLQARTLIDQLESMWLMASADLELSGGLTHAGSGSLLAWMQHHCRMAPGEASARSRVAHAVSNGELRQTGDAMCDGAVTWRQAQVIHNAVRQVPEDRHDEAESAMLTAAQTLDPGPLRRVGERLLHCFDREAAEEPQRAATSGAASPWPRRSTVSSRFQGSSTR